MQAFRRKRCGGLLFYTICMGGISMRTEIQDFIDQEAPSGLQLSPDGRFGAFVVTKPDGEENCYHSWL